MRETNHDASSRGGAPPREIAGFGTLVRRMLLALVLVGAFGLLAELVLLEHFDSITQWVPLVALGAGAASAVALWAWPGWATVRLFQAMMLVFIASGAVGLCLHYRGNVEFEREMDATARGLALVWRSLRGATPTLAPGALAQLGLLGLIASFRHPALARAAAPANPPKERP